MPSKTSTLRGLTGPSVEIHREKLKKKTMLSGETHPAIEEVLEMSDNEFDFVEAYDDEPVSSETLLAENSAASAIKVGFIGVGGGGGKLAKSFIDCGFTQTLLVNTTEKDQPDGVDPLHFLLIPGADGVGKDVNLGKRVLDENSASVEDAVRSRIGHVDWLFVLAGGGGGTGSACHSLHGSLTRFLTGEEASGRVVYVISKPSAQELLNPTIKSNYEKLAADITNEPHIIIDNEKQLSLLRGKVGMLGMYPKANSNFAKMLTQVLKLASESSPIQTFDSKDLEKCFSQPGRMVIGTSVIRDTSVNDLGSKVLTGCLKSSPCPPIHGNTKTGVMLLLLTEDTASDPAVSKRLEAAFSYVGGRTETLFSGVYIKPNLPGIIAISMFGGILSD